MRKTKWFASFALAAGMLVAGTTAASAEDWRDVRHDYSQADWLRSTVAGDRARLAEDLRCGNRFAADRDRAILSRHESDLRATTRDIRRDTRGFDRDYDGYRR
jgi:hypothetical protein